MKTKTKKPKTEKPATLTKIVEPLLDILNRQYSTASYPTYEFLKSGKFDMPYWDHDWATIQLPTDIHKHELAMRALYAILMASTPKWGWGHIDKQHYRRPPLRFSIAERFGWVGNFWAGSRYLFVEHIDKNPETAARQIATLVAHLSNPANLGEGDLPEKDPTAFASAAAIAGATYFEANPSAHPSPINIIPPTSTSGISAESSQPV